MIQMAVLGFGTVGSGVVEIIEQNAHRIERAVPEGLHVKYILDIRDFPDSPYGDRVVHDLDIILNDPEVRLVCETMGGKEPARTFTQKALERGISVCTSNKELVAAFGPSLLKTAREHNCSYLFEASVGGGIPLLDTLLSNLAQEDITSVTGILNGTTNYILTKMESEGADYKEVLSRAQAMGYAERNPAADVEGHDAGRKIAILSSLITGKNVAYEEIHVEGITGVTMDDIKAADELGYGIKLLGRCCVTEQGLEVITAPFCVKKSHPLYPVRDVFNAVLVHGNMVDDIMLYGRGAGKLPTGSAVVSDLIQMARADKPLVIRWDEEPMELVPFGMQKHCFWLRVENSIVDRVLALFTDSTELLHQDFSDFTVIMTGPVREDDFAQRTAGVEGILSVLRILES